MGQFSPEKEHLKWLTENGFGQLQSLNWAKTVPFGTAEMAIRIQFISMLGIREAEHAGEFKTWAIVKRVNSTVKITDDYYYRTPKRAYEAMKTVVLADMETAAQAMNGGQE